VRRSVGLILSPASEWPGLLDCIVDVRGMAAMRRLTPAMVGPVIFLSLQIIARRAAARTVCFPNRCRGPRAKLTHPV